MLTSYNSILLSSTVFILYFLTFFLVKKNKIKLLTHRKIWNFILLFSFLISGLIGIALAFMIDNKISISWYSNILWLHVEFGIIMGIVSIFHTIWHIKYYINIKKH